MGKKKDKSTASKKARGTSAIAAKGGQLLDKILPAAFKGSSGGTSPSKTNPGKTSPGKNPLRKDRVMQAAGGGIVLIAAGALALFAISSSHRSAELPSDTPAAVTSSRAASEAAVVPMPAEPQAPQKVANKGPVEARPEASAAGKAHHAKGEVASHGKTKASLKKAAGSKQKSKAAKSSKRVKKALAAKSMD